MMKERLHAQLKAAPPPWFMPAHGAMLQRKCACGGSADLAGECGGGSNQSLSIQCSTGNSEPETRNSVGVPPLVHEVLRSPGQPLDAETRAFMEPRFGHNFGNVRVHIDEQAATSARGINALAYTVGENIVFGSGKYAPATPSGRHLLAHELTHVLQQQRAENLEQTGGQSATISQPAQSALVVGTTGDSYEQEADRVARRVVEGGIETHPFPIFAEASRSVQRQQPAPAPQPAAPVVPVAPNQAQQTAIDAARAAAAIRTQIALMRLRGITPPGPPGRPDPGQQMRERAIRLARVMFDWPNPNMDQIEEVVSSMVSRLANPRVMVAGANDPECGNRSAYVVGLQPPIVLCPMFFSSTPEEQTRTMIHESAHLAGIGNASMGESYCVVFDCQTSCGGFDSADSWAQFVHCLSGQTPDQPPVVQGQPPAAPPGGAKP
jgi:hypothetical protein